MKADVFRLQKWMDEHGDWAEVSLGSSYSPVLSLQELSEMSSDASKPPIVDVDKKQGYGHMLGTPQLKENIARLYTERSPPELPMDPGMIVTTTGGSGANFCALYSLVQPGDHVICQWPTYQQLYGIPQQLGARVDLWKSDLEKGWDYDIASLKKLLREDTKMIIINVPQNPTGAIMKRSQIEQIIDIARERNIIIHSDEVFRPIVVDGPQQGELPPSILSFGYPNVVEVGSMAKAYSLPGVRIGWIATRSQDIYKKCMVTRQYTNASIGQSDESIAAFALSKEILPKILSRNTRTAKIGVDMLEKFVNEHRDVCRWQRPAAGTVAFLQFFREGRPVDSTSFCESLQRSQGVLVIPGDINFGEEYQGFVRVGFVIDQRTLEDALRRVHAFLEQGFKDVPLSEDKRQKLGSKL